MMGGARLGRDLVVLGVVRVQVGVVGESGIGGGMRWGRVGEVGVGVGVEVEVWVRAVVGTEDGGSACGILIYFRESAVSGVIIEKAISLSLCNIAFNISAGKNCTWENTHTTPS